ncbi:hypothetical protein C488_15787 [Natrinema pellirubrum DSM 15624]|uniref:DUF7344 domain-containing protein n=1 Tax=Natrinema pellirubrum (strain DSM 15624 / CIP 106293 / JCM 10476 / NCIMB 786 / 157) TaxID=797303 RepID=L0JP65_NATP1|nr:hypothetical protein [Natrinema pellirubrum]AGB33044.1 hypothetical protein Natpe_3254 [Natrinema pellirubrum DSM 15624]ELY71925.1 hypothetical protein C488_15787 [Natrinema pellirubrum DSM 15624]
MSLPPFLELTTTAADVLADPHRRTLLAVLRDREGQTPTATTAAGPAMPIADLATEVAAVERGTPIVPDAHCERLQIELIHRHVPRLVDRGVLSRDADGDDPAVSLTAHPILDLEWVESLLTDPTGDDVPVAAETLTRTLEALREPRRLTVCTELASRDGSIAVDDLAAGVLVREGEADRPADVAGSQRTAVATELAHKQLPALAAAGLVAHDDESGRAALETDAPHWDVDWLADGPLAEAAALVRSDSTRRARPEREPSVPARTIARDSDENRRTGTDVESCWTLEGEANVAERGNEIAAGADEELFVMAPSAVLLGSTCLENLRDAADRGVDVYVASRSPRVRDTVRSAVPTATVCEPRFDWFSFPVDAPQCGYVLLADREAAMLVTAECEVGDESVRAGAITGEGRENALVSVVRTQLGPRLDRLPTAGDETDGTPLPM